MKNLLIYLTPDKKFNGETAIAVKIQIDNSLRLGWKRKDIMLVTNFEYKYKGVKSIVIDDKYICPYFAPTRKLWGILGLFDSGIIGDKNEKYWFHDFDTFQLNPIAEDEPIEMKGYDLGVSNYGQRIRLCSASMFFNEKARDIFEWMKKECLKDKANEEQGLMRLIYDSKNLLSKRCKIINTTYAFFRFNPRKTYKTSIKPLRAAHFHLTPDKYDFYVNGNNQLNKVLIPDGLIKIFHKHGFKQNVDLLNN